jgi:hypothetical protein
MNSKRTSEETVLIAKLYAVRNGKTVCARWSRKKLLFQYGAQCIERGVMEMVGLAASRSPNRFCRKSCVKAMKRKSSPAPSATIAEQLIRRAKWAAAQNKTNAQELLMTRKKKARLKIAHT